MPWTSARSRAVLLGFAAGITVAVAAKPLYLEVVVRLNQQRYAELVFECDNAMREHFIAKARAGFVPGEDSANDLRSSELALVDCHEYDFFQKRLMQFGLTENELGRMRLDAIESGGVSPREIVEIHEIRY